MKQAFHQKKRFTLNSRVTVLEMKTTNMLKQFCKEFNIESMKDSTTCTMSDVLLLADCFDNFRNICMNHYGLDPACYFSASGLAWDATLKITKVQLELISDPEMLSMIESGIREGIATISPPY